MYCPLTWSFWFAGCPRVFVRLIRRIGYDCDTLFELEAKSFLWIQVIVYVMWIQTSHTFAKHRHYKRSSITTTLFEKYIKKVYCECSVEWMQNSS